MTLSFKQKQNKTHSLVEHCSRANNIAILRDLVLESSLSLLLFSSFWMNNRQLKCQTELELDLHAHLTVHRLSLLLHNSN